MTIAILTATVLCLGLLTSSALAAKRKVPFGFFGTVIDPSVTLSASPAALGDQLGLMARSGVESVRSNIYWSATEPAPNTYNWSESDKLVLAAAQHGLSLLPIIEFTPGWAAPHNPADGKYLPSDPRVFGGFMTAMVKRYGPHGTFWSFHPSLRRYAVRDWQIWNEPAGTYDWRSKPWPSTYTKLLRAGYTAVHAADHGAKVVSAAMVGLNGHNLTPWAEARALYGAGARRYFDVMAVNAFTNNNSAAVAVSRSVLIVNKVRAVMRAHGDAHKPIWVTEVTWTAAQGKIPRKDYAGFETTSSGQAARLKDYYSYVATHRATGIQRAFWYTWASTYNLKNTEGTIPTFLFSGLVRWTPGGSFQSLPVLVAYERAAARLEGCRKSSVATVCA